MAHMPAVAFDTHAVIKRLQTAGMDYGQAEAVSDAVSTIALGPLANKTDLKRIANELRIELRDLEQRLTVRMGAMEAATVTILGALIAFHR